MAQTGGQQTGGGFGDRPGNMPDPFHTFFALSGLSLIAENESGRVSVPWLSAFELKEVDAIYAITRKGQEMNLLPKIR